MSTAGGSSYPEDLTGRMADFGRMFAQQAGLVDPTRIRTALDLVHVIESRLPRASGEEAPIFEAAAYMGEWLRAHSGAAWVAEGPYEPHLQFTDTSRSIIVLLPLVSILRTASGAGYDGLGALLTAILRDVSNGVGPCRPRAIRVAPPEDQPRVVAWVDARLATGPATSASLWRRCSACARIQENDLELPRSPRGWEHEAGIAASVLAEREFSCECGGSPGEVSRLLVLRPEPDGLRLADIFVSPTHTRIGCWTFRGDLAFPFDATVLTRDDLVV